MDLALLLHQIFPSFFWGGSVFRTTSSRNLLPGGDSPRLGSAPREQGQEEGNSLREGSGWISAGISSWKGLGSTGSAQGGEECPSLEVSKEHLEVALSALAGDKVGIGHRLDSDHRWSQSSFPA